MNAITKEGYIAKYIFNVGSSDNPYEFATKEYDVWLTGWMFALYSMEEMGIVQ